MLYNFEHSLLIFYFSRLFYFFSISMNLENYFDNVSHFFRARRHCMEANEYENTVKCLQNRIFYPKFLHQKPDGISSLDVDKLYKVNQDCHNVAHKVPHTGSRHKMAQHLESAISMPFTRQNLTSVRV